MNVFFNVNKHGDKTACLIHRIPSSYQPSADLKQLYCSCNNPECGHTFVMEVTFSHTLSPSAMDIPRAALEKIRQGNQMEQRDIFSVLEPPMQQAG